LTLRPRGYYNISDTKLLNERNSYIVEEELVLTALNISPRYCAKVTSGYISSTMSFVSAMLSLGYIRREISAQEIFDTSLIDAIHPEDDHY
jgi:hypothetical protein